MSNRKKSGFTLIELLIALALIGLMVVLLFGALRFSGKAWAVTEAKTEHDAGMRLVWQYLSDRLEQARTLSAIAKAADGAHFFFSGASSAVEFVSPMPAHLGSGGLYIIRLNEAGANGKKTLRLTRWLYHPEVLEGEAGIPKWNPLVNASLISAAQEKPELRAWYSESDLIDDLKDVEFSYFGPKGKNDATGDWTQDWEDQKFLPWLLKIEITDSKGAWPEMVFELPSS